MILAVIPARAGSKRLPGKNLMDLGGRPLLAYSVLLARSIPEIDRVVVVSDGEEILEAGRNWDAQACLLPVALADGAHMLETVQFALADSPYLADWVVLLQPTSPLRLVEQCRDWIKETLALYKLSANRADNVDGLLTVDIGAYKLGSVDLDGYYRPEYQPGIEKQQMAPKARENGLFYLLRADIIRRGRLFGDRLLPRGCRQEQSLANIDYQWDFAFTRWAFEQFDYRREFNKLEKVFNDTVKE